MPFDLTENGGGGGSEPDKLLTKALSIVIGALYARGMRPGHFGPGHFETINLDVTIHVSEDGSHFRIDNMEMHRWEQIEIDPESDPDPDDII